MSEQILSNVLNAVVEGDDELVVQVTKEAIDAGVEPLTIINEGLTKGIEVVGEHFSTGYYFLPDLILGAKAMEAGIQVVEPLLAESSKEPIGKVLIGTVQGDMHDLGKGIVAIMLKSAGFEVIDLGVDVPSQTFIEKAKELKPQIIGMSALLTTTVGKQKEVMEYLQEEGIRNDVKVIIGGAPINQAWADQIGADGYAEDALGAVEIAKKLLA